MNDLYELKQVAVRLKLKDVEPLYSEERIDTPEVATKIMADVMKELDREHLAVLNLDSAGHVISFNIVSIGDINSTMVPVANVFKAAILQNASRIILMHNHPSSSNKISEQDILATKKLMYASVFMGIDVLDHIVVSGMTGECYSMVRWDPDLFDKSNYTRTIDKVAESLSDKYERKDKNEEKKKEAGMVH
ncbi:MAG TPA: hypothetical protein DCW44_02270 [Eubacterium sp.]|nr:hypothetical protein [Eubacterium sp.]